MHKGWYADFKDRCVACTRKYEVKRANHTCDCDENAFYHGVDKCVSMIACALTLSALALICAGVIAGP